MVFGSRCSACGRDFHTTNLQPYLLPTLERESREACAFMFGISVGVLVAVLFGAAVVLIY